MKIINPEPLENKNNNKDPLHGVTLAMILDFLVDEYGFEELSEIIKINCFAIDPSKKSSLKFLRRTEWARKKVEELYIDTKMNKN